MQRFLDPAVLAGISSLDLLAKTVVDGFVAGLHRSPDFGFSQEFAVRIRVDQGLQTEPADFLAPMFNIVQGSAVENFVGLGRIVGGRGLVYLFAFLVQDLRIALAGA